MMIENNTKQKKFISVIGLISICLIIFTVNALAWEQGSEPGGGSAHGGCNGSCAMTSSSGYPYGYRIYLMDNDGNILARSDAINPQGINSFKVFTGNRIRKEVVGIGNGAVAAANYTSTTMFGRFMHVSNVADFDSVFIRSQGLIHDPANNGSYCTSRNGSTCVDTTNETDKQYMLQKLQSFLTSVGITYKAEDLYNMWNSSTNRQNIYLAAEAIGTVRTNEGYVAGTCTELIYYAWQDGYDGATCGSNHNVPCQNGVLLELCGTATLTNFSGGGYYATSKNYSTSWQSYSSPIFTRIISGNKVNGNVEGISIFLWKVSDLFGTKQSCPASVPENERCSLANYKTAGCCSCAKAAELESKGVSIPTTVKNSYQYYPTCTYTPPPACPYKLDTKIPNTCSSDGNSGYVGDEASWKCTFTSTNSTNDSTVRNNYYFSAFSNSYCTIYCQEQIDFDLPGSGAYTDAGTYLTISANSGYQTLGPIRYKGTSTCRSTTSVGSEAGTINLSKFYTDFAAADHAVLVAYDNWQYAELQNEVINNATSHDWSRTCTDSWCVDWEPNTCAEGVSSCGSHCVEHDSCSESRSGTYYTYDNKTFYGATFTAGTGISNGSCGCTSRCGSSCTAKVSLKNVASLKQVYINAVNRRTAVLEELKKCNNFYRTYVEFKPSVSFYYEDDLYESTYNLKASGTASSVTNYFMTGNAAGTASSSTRTKINSVTHDSTDSATYYADSNTVSGNSSYIAYYDCGFGVTKTKCTAIGYYLYPTNTWFEQVTTRTYSYSLPDNINQYVNKPSGQSTNAPISDNYDYIPFSNLPVHYSTKVGTYKYSITTTSFGNNNKFNNYIIGNQAFNKVSYKKSTKYECTYKVACDKTIICGKNSCDNSCGDDDDDDTGTDLIFRSISLYYPFPGQNATTTNVRESGANWKTYYGNNVVSDFIYNNRGVSYYEIYKLQPMYEITLTPALMRKIKSYNDQQNSINDIYYAGTKKQTTAISGYSDFTLKCKTNSDGSKSKNCTSAIIRNWGVKGCAISGSGYTKCGNTVAW